MSLVVTCDVMVKLWVYIFSVQNCDMEKLLSLQIIFFLDYSVTFYYSHSTKVSGAYLEVSSYRTLRAPALLFNWHLLCNGYVVIFDLIRRSKSFLQIDIQYPKVPKSMIWCFANKGIGDFVSLLLWLLKSTNYKISYSEAKVGPRGL